MTRLEQIEQKAKELGQKYFPDEYNIWARPNYEAQYVEYACKEMLEWADKKVEEHSASDMGMVIPIVNMPIILCKISQVMKNFSVGVLLHYLNN